MLDDLDTLTRDGLHGIEQIVELVANLRSFSRLDRSKVASFNVNEGVRATLLIAQSSLRRIEVERHLGDIPSITCSPSQVNQVLLNLLNNSSQAMDKPQGRITITTIAYKIVTQHGGRIDVRSTPGEGTTVTVTLPVEPPPELATLADEEITA
jgi:signal transduction histidine kinase